MFWMDWRELEKHNDWGVRDKDDATAAMWNEGADVWEKRSAEELEFAKKQVDALAITKEDRVLDVCCGTGPLTMNLCRKAAWVTAFDFNEKMLDYVRKKAAEKEVSNISYLQGNFNTIEPGKDFEAADIAVTRHSPAQGNILKFSRFATKYCYSLAQIRRADDDFPLPRRKGGFWCRSANGNDNYAERPDARKYGLNITFNLLYESGTNPELFYVEDRKMVTGATYEELAAKYFPPAQTPEILEYIKKYAERTKDGYRLEKIQTMSILGWDPSGIDWSYLERQGILF